MLTYERLRSVTEEERTSTGLVSLPPDFFSQAAAYVKSKEKLANDSWELDAAKRLFSDLKEIRERKLLTSALYAVRAGVALVNVTPEEQPFVDALIKVIRDFHESKPQGIEFLQDVPAFVGLDLKPLGPFKKGEKIKLPSELMALLVKKKAARTIDL